MNHGLKRILERTVKDNPKMWPRKLDEALSAFRTAFKTPIGTTPFRLIYGKTCHLPVEIEHKAYWALKRCNLDLKEAGENHFLQLHELEELRLQAYDNSLNYKARSKELHDNRLKEFKVFNEGDKVLLFQSNFKFTLGKLRSRWASPFVVKKAFPSGYFELYGKGSETFIVNGHRLKHYHEGMPNTEREDLTLYPKDK